MVAKQTETTFKFYKTVDKNTEHTNTRYTPDTKNISGTIALSIFSHRFSFFVNYLYKTEII